MNGKKMKKPGRKKRIFYGISFVLLFFTALSIVLIAAKAVNARNQFHKGTMLNGIDVSEMSIEDLKQRLNEYRLTIVERTEDGETFYETITGEQIRIQIAAEESLYEILSSQSIWESDNKEYHIEDFVKFDEAVLEREISKLKNLQPDFTKKPEDAYLSEYNKDSGYEIVPEKKGNYLNKERTFAVIKDAVNILQESVDLEKEDCYEKPQITSESERLNELLSKLKRYTEVKITYSFGESKEILDGNKIQEWLSIGGDEVTLDHQKVQDYVADLRSRYDTIFRSRVFQTSYGKEIKLKDGDYGWWMNYVQEAEELSEMIEAGESGEREPVYYQKAAAYGPKDYGNTYIEINLTAQHLFFYKDGKLMLESDFVSGNTARGWETPEGIYGITYKERDAVLEGETYRTPVCYWMPFNQNVGLHDALWRSDFGGNLYKTSGSHGCINLPYRIAKEIYSNIEQGTAVICYYLPETESKEITTQSAEDIAQSAIDAINRIGTVTRDSQRRIARARELYNQLTSSQREFVTNYNTLLEAEKAWKSLN